MVNFFDLRGVEIKLFFDLSCNGRNFSDFIPHPWPPHVMHDIIYEWSIALLTNSRRAYYKYPLQPGFHHLVCIFHSLVHLPEEYIACACRILILNNAGTAKRDLEYTKRFLPLEVRLLQ